ncbi:hypothetical protein AYO21_07294 [Fonsecaea monophora]|uniref:Fungal N-terminal domain-containing protein n=1 Tax=Fonsecaea monophora TaxID=254056 RepID=A0A177F541_9EURO|nr:hypothetical protein AYO21_07294 [Fonsecaea monophora]OAG38472.1 hypothetical protein AYO21_07294 [Fonsecaea monophora]
MSDPLSATSSVIGVVSLGLVVCQGLVTYFSTYKGQNQYLDSLTQRAENLQGCLTLLQHALPLWTVRFSDTAPHIEQHITACQASIVVLSSKLSGFKRTPGPSLHRDKLRYVAHKAAFPFTKATITELSGILDGLQENLHTVLCIVGLEASSILVKTQDVTNTKIDAVLSASGVMTARIQSASHDLSCLRAEMSTIQNDLQAVKSILGPGVPTLIQRTDGPSPNANPQNWQQGGLEIRKVQSQHLPTLTSPTGTSLHALPGRPTCSTTHTSEWSNSYICLCLRTITRRPTRSKMLFVDYFQTQEHEEDCPYYLPGAKRRKMDIWISFRSVLISRGVRCMVSLATGSAGGISANIDWIPVVSSETSPAIRVIEEVYGMLKYSVEPNVLVDNARVELMGLFAQRRAHPREVDQFGHSLLWYASFLAAWLACRRQGATRSLVSRDFAFRFEVRNIRICTDHFCASETDAAFQSFCRLLYSLASLGAKANLEDVIDGFTLLGGASAEFGALTEDLSQRGALENPSDKGKITAVYKLVDCPQWYHVLENGPLGQAILRRNPEEAIRLLQQKPSLIGELNDWGHSLLHLSIDWPLGLVILLKYGGSSLINVEDNSGAKPVRLALKSSGIATMILIAAGSGLDDNALEDVMFTSPEGVSQELFDVAVEGLVYRRKQLQRIAESYLPQYRRSFAADALKVLDEQAVEVSTALEESGIRIPGVLSIPKQQKTIYHIGELSARDAQRFFNNGFEDIDGRDYRGYTPLMGRHWWRDGPLALQYAQWLYDRGANLLCQFPTCTNNNCAETEIQDEERHLISLLESLMVEFTEQWLWPTSDWKVDEFMSKVWRPRLRQIRQERAQMSAGDQAQMRRMGVEVHYVDENSLTEDGDEDDRYAEDDPSTYEGVYWDGSPPRDTAAEIAAENAARNAARKVQSEKDLGEIRAFFTDSEVAEILKEAARENGLEDYDIWFSIVEKLDARQNERV